MGAMSSSLAVASKVREMGSEYESAADAVLRYDLSGRFLTEVPGFEICDFMVSRCPNLDAVQRRRLLFELDCIKRKEEASWVSDSDDEHDDVSVQSCTKKEMWRRRGSRYIGAKLSRKVWDGPRLVLRRGVVVAWCRARDSSFIDVKGRPAALWRAEFEGLDETIELEEHDLRLAIQKRHSFVTRQRIRPVKKEIYSRDPSYCAVRARQLALPSSYDDTRSASPTLSEESPNGVVTRRSSTISLVSISEEEDSLNTEKHIDELDTQSITNKKRKRSPDHCSSLVFTESATNCLPLIISDHYPQLPRIEPTKTHFSLTPNTASELMLFDDFLSFEYVPVPCIEEKTIAKKPKTTKRPTKSKAFCNACQDAPCRGTHCDCFFGISEQNGKYLARDDNVCFHTPADAARRFDFLYPSEACNLTKLKSMRKKDLIHAPEGDLEPGSFLSDSNARKWYIARDEDTLTSICKKNNLNPNLALIANKNCAHFCSKGPKLTVRAKLKQNTRVLLTF